MRGELPECFTLKPVKAAKVSEISEAVAASEIPQEERVNFHIGNPASDPSLGSLYQEILFQGEEEDIPAEQLELIKKASEKSVPYAPRGGFKAKAPSSLASKVHSWLTEDQREPLEYNLGRQAGKREIIFQSGGMQEALRVFLHALSRYLQSKLSRVISAGIQIPQHLKQFGELEFQDLDSVSGELVESLEPILGKNETQPNFLVLGKRLSDQERRQLRRLCLRSNLFILEVNNALNHDSIAREAGLMNRVIRFVEMSAVSPLLSNSPLVITLGNGDYLEVMESVHFELKGTPPVSEMVLASWLMSQEQESEEISNPVDIDQSRFQAGEETLESGIGQYLNRLEGSIERIENRISRFNGRVKTSALMGKFPEDEFALLSPAQLVEMLFRKINAPALATGIEAAFLSTFQDVFPRYKKEACLVVSGSARTALSILGFNCGIKEVVTPDLGWTYHHCFGKVTTVSLEDDLSLNTASILKTVNEKLEADPWWRQYGAVALNSPHNASGLVYSEEKLRFLLKKLLGKKVMVIDDLSYENIHPRADLQGAPTMRQIVNELVANGELKPEHGDCLITVHSLSKTDCFAGGRLAVVEIRRQDLRAALAGILSQIQPNIFSLFIAYLFYRRGREAAERFWLQRNRVFQLRMAALQNTVKEFPAERNPFGLKIIEPQGSMYPRLEVGKLPDGISLDWLSSRLATQGVGLVPLTTFARTERSYELARKAFRLSLGGGDSHKILETKMRKTLINLNRLIAAEADNYTRYSLNSGKFYSSPVNTVKELVGQIRLQAEKAWKQVDQRNDLLKDLNLGGEEWREHLDYRLNTLMKQAQERILLREKMISETSRTAGSLKESLEREFYKDDLKCREARFRHRLYDRTVHPTQMFSLNADLLIQEMADKLYFEQKIDRGDIEPLAGELVDEFRGMSVAISSRQESNEVLADLHALVRAEEWARWFAGEDVPAFLSFWSDWDGSTRPSGQGHRLVAAVVQENIYEMVELLEILAGENSKVESDKELQAEISSYRKQSRKFRDILDEITDLTQVLEKRYRGLLPVDLRPGWPRKMAMNLGLSRDPVSSLLEHNDRLERRMGDLKQQRREKLEYFFSLNKKLRKELHSKLDKIISRTNDKQLLLRFTSFHDRLQRFVMTPRIHQKTILDSDSFTIDRTVENIVELNQIGARYGNPGLVLGLQISMSTDPEALIHLDRKFAAEKRKRELQTGIKLPDIRLIPLFEEKTSVEALESYLDRIWDYCDSSRGMDQTTQGRFTGLICEIFIAGSDLSQQLSQTMGADLYKEAKLTTCRWAAEKGIAHRIRVKLGSGEPMQRQGGYYDEYSGASALSGNSDESLLRGVKQSAVRALLYARSPLAGLMAGGEFRTLQSNVSEKLRHISHQAFANCLHHIGCSQARAEASVARAARTMINTRLNLKKREEQELERAIKGNRTAVWEKFSQLNSVYFRRILYGMPEDLVGIHVISYFISRTTPPLRDRPVVRPSRHSGLNKSRQVMDQLGSVVPLAENGSMLRAIGHNRAQTAVLGINQLTTGLFRALSDIRKQFNSAEEGNMVISDHILPHLPVKEILSSLRIYQDQGLSLVSEMEELFPAGCAVFQLLREDRTASFRFIGLFQEELLRRQGLKPADFFEAGVFRQELLPLFRPDLAVLLQEDIFNRDYDQLDKHFRGNTGDSWRRQVGRLLQVAKRIESRRLEIWELINKPLKRQVSSFVKVATAISLMTSSNYTPATSGNVAPAVKDISRKLGASLKGEKDESLQEFLSAAINFLSNASEQDGLLPVEVIRVLKDVRQILNIEEQALGKEEQRKFNFLLLSIARLAGENG